jgi:glucose-6-phosphate-specific signal transduction histidine kinase
MPAALADSVKQGLPTGAGNKPPLAGMGLQTMHYRARVIGGTFTVMPRKGRGTIISCTIPRQTSDPPSEKIRRHRRASAQ